MYILLLLLLLLLLWFKSPRVVLSSLCSQEWPWTSDGLATTHQVTYTLFGCKTCLLTQWTGGWQVSEELNNEQPKDYEIPLGPSRDGNRAAPFPHWSPFHCKYLHDEDVQTLLNFPPSHLSAASVSWLKLPFQLYSPPKDLCWSDTHTLWGTRPCAHIIFTTELSFMAWVCNVSPLGLRA